MTEQENCLWFLLTGVLAGMLIDFWCDFDVGFFRVQWMLLMAVLLVWAMKRD